MVLSDTLHQILAEDLPPLQELRGCELGDHVANLCGKSLGLSLLDQAHPVTQPHPHSS